MSPNTNCNKSVCFIQLLESVSKRCRREVSQHSEAGAICVCLVFFRSGNVAFGVFVKKCMESVF